MLSRVTAGDVLERVVQALADMRSPERLLAIILTETLRMLDAQGAYMLWIVGDRLVLRASAGLIPPGREAGVPLGNGIEGWVAQQGEAVAVANLARYPRFGPTDLGQVGALLAVPMRLRGEVVGVMVATRVAPGRFAESDRWWLSIFAEIAAVALENHRLLDRERRRAREAEVLAELATIPLEPPAEFARQLAEHVNRLLGAERTEVWVADAAGTLVPLGAQGTGGGTASGRPGHSAGAGPLSRPARETAGASASRPAPSGRSAGSRSESTSLALARRVAPATILPPGPLTEVYRTGESLLCNDTQELPALADQLGTTTLRSVLAVPLWVGDSRHGVVWTGAARPGAFGPDEQTFLTLVATRVGLRLGNAELARRRAEIQRAEVEQQAKQAFLSVVSHELKTPVAVIKAYTELLQERAARGSGTSIDRDVLNRIGEQADRMLALVEQFLDLQRIEAGLMPLEESRFDLAELARRLAQALQVTTSTHRLRVEAPEPVYVRADRRRIEQVLQILLDNAIKYSPQGGPITVRVTAAPVGEGGTPMALVSVQDQGIGMTAEEAAHVFERFYQAESVPVRGHVGLGLGLYISREIVTRHGGRIWVESAPGKGSTFSFTLPLAPRGSEPLPDPAPELEAAARRD